MIDRAPRTGWWSAGLVGALVRGLAVGLTAGLVLPGLVTAQEAGDPVDLARLASPLPAPDRGVRWVAPVRVREVWIDRAADADPRMWRVEWWGSVWPDHGTGGWMRLDDPWNGQWVRVDAAPEPAGDGTWRITLPVLTKAEWPKSLEPRRYRDGRAPAHRKTLAIRLVDEAGAAVPAPTRLRVLGDARWTRDAFDLHHRRVRDGASTLRLEITHGHLLDLEPLSPDVAVDGLRWSGEGPAGSSSGVRATILCVESPDANGEEQTRVTVRTSDDPRATGFSFVPRDVPDADCMRLPDFGLLVARPRLGRTWENDPGPGPAAWDRRVRRRLTGRPEATRASAMAGLPRLAPARDIPIGVPSARQEIFVSPGGDWGIFALSLPTDGGRDAGRWVFSRSFGNARQYGELWARLDTREEPLFDGDDREELERHLEEQSLPLVHVRWRTGPIRYHHELVATMLTGDYGDDEARRGDETVVLLTRLTAANPTDTAQTATVHLRYDLDWPLRLDGQGLISVDWPDNRERPPGLLAVRGQVAEAPRSSGRPGEWTTLPASGPDVSRVLRWQATLEPGEKRVLHFKAPFVDLLEPEELARLRSISFEEEAPKVLDYWRSRLARRTRIEVPDPMLNSLYQANLWHILITTDRDPGTGLYNQGVGTVQYRVFANETVMIARYMDLVGEHREAERFLEPMLRYQGTEPLTGRFSTRKGALHSAGQYTHGQYAMNHGFVLWGVADHYLITRSREYLDRVLPRLIDGCDFLIRERRATLTPPGVARRPTHGLAPASSLEDVIEFQHWFATNSYFHLGMRRVAEALTVARHPEASRIAREAEAYRRDIEIAAREATTRAAVVRLRDHTWIPYVPSRVFQWRHLTEGWIREALYPALHLAAGEIVPSSDPLIGWMLDDLEDNIFFSWQSGYNVSDYQQTWFEHGGVTLQPCLLELLPTYLARDEIQAALRSFWNTYALSIYPDVHCFAEWARRFGQGGGPVYKTSDEARFLIWLRQLLLQESKGEWWYGRGVPRAWLEDGERVVLEDAPTRLGRTSLVIESAAMRGEIRARIRLPDRELPRAAWVRLRHPEGKSPTSVRVGGRPLPGSLVRGEDIRLPLERSRPGDELRLVARYD